MLMGLVNIQEVVRNMSPEFRGQIWARYTDRKAIHIQVVTDVMNEISQK